MSHDLCMVHIEAAGDRRLTHGAFDVTVGPLVNLWGFGPDGEDRIPSDEAHRSGATLRR